ncbi:alkyl hydroperoxide reductase subunit F [Raineyella fluvialis]|uniref:Alkyl hydroperoxide reductase subunit F n=1 Tax=Raineyella fluvialis TaxID=2662261 RepID=A0A5Q2FAC8_9ACTN|nr:alkyl hydroperoxide reductase subunit F [Raineyella fluvialis]QGF23759.1 alkyl hydroperoxide reductase subunit F [Raineyella fluvialis]
MLDATLKTQLKEQYFTKLTEPVELVSSLDDRPKSREMAELLDELAGLSALVTHRRADDDERRPSFAITRPGSDISIRFAGIPMGHEFSSLVLALLQVGGVPVKEDAETLEAVANLEGDFEFVTYMSLSCQNCPTVVQALNSMAVLNPQIKHTAVEGSLFQDEIEERRILAVPTIYLNGEEWGSGRTDMKQFVERLDHHAASRTAEKLNAREPYDVLVVGGGPAGASAAIYAARKGIRTGMVCDRIGGQVLDTLAIENHVSQVYTEGPKLGAAYAEHMNAYDIDQIAGVQATRLIPGEDGELHTVEFEGGGRLQAQSVILATGARWRTLGVPGEADYRNKGVSFCPHCDGPLFKGKPIAVVGGGNSGVEAAIDLAGVTEHVTVIEFLDQLKADEVLLRKLHSLPNTEVVTSARTTQVDGDGRAMTSLQYEDRETGELRTLDVAGVFVQIGLLPNTEWLKGSIPLSPRGEVIITEKGETAIPGIYAAGDCTTVPFKQIVIAEGSGATAALAAFEHMIRTTAPVPAAAL